jgi:hypothetical protein
MMEEVVEIVQDFTTWNELHCCVSGTKRGVLVRTLRVSVSAGLYREA